MKPTDLKAGNFVLHYDEIITVDGIDDIDVFNTETGDIPLHSVSPIPLTNQWLELFGFNKIEIETDDVYSKVIHKAGGLDLKKLIVYLESDGYTIGILDNYSYVEVVSLWHLKYQFVHQLQNVYHALTGEDLTTKKINYLYEA
jgi:hypothetical protein